MIGEIGAELHDLFKAQTPSGEAFEFDGVPTHAMFANNKLVKVINARTPLEIIAELKAHGMMGKRKSRVNRRKATQKGGLFKTLKRMFSRKPKMCSDKEYLNQMINLSKSGKPNDVQTVKDYDKRCNTKLIPDSMKYSHQYQYQEFDDPPNKQSFIDRNMKKIFTNYIENEITTK